MKTNSKREQAMKSTKHSSSRITNPTATASARDGLPHMPPPWRRTMKRRSNYEANPHDTWPEEGCMATPGVVHIRLEEYLATDYRPDREWIDGDLRERNLGTWEHARVQALLAAWLGQHEEEWGVVGTIGQRIRISSNRVRILISPYSTMASSRPSRPSRRCWWSRLCLRMTATPTPRRESTITARWDQGDMDH
jgi:hypothetical protein